MSDKTISFTIDGMHCGGCVRRVTGALQGVDGVSELKVEIGTATFVADDDDALLEEAKAAVAALGFTVTGQQASS